MPVPPREERNRTLLGAAAVVAAVLAQLAGMFALLYVVSLSDVPLNHGIGLGCYQVHLSGDVPRSAVRERVDSNQIRQSWSWSPPGLSCRVDVGHRTITVREPAWKEMAWPVFALGAFVVAGSVLVTAAVFCLRPARWSFRRTATTTASLSIFQPLVLATALVAVVLPCAV